MDTYISEHGDSDTDMAEMVTRVSPYDLGMTGSLKCNQSHCGVSTECKEYKAQIGSWRCRFRDVAYM